MERSGNFYKAIRLGYILISILIGCMAYNSLYEWQEIEALELGNKKIDELRKEINNINIQMIKFSLLGETILEWNDKDIEHYHARRMAMDSMLCRFKATYPAERIDSVRSLLEDKERQMFQIVRLMDEQQSINKKIANQIPVIVQKSVQEQSKKPKRKGFLGIFGKKKEVTPAVSTTILHSVNRMQDRNKHNQPPYAYNVCKVFVLCKVLGGSFQPNIETVDSRYFGLDELPVLAEEKNNKEQIEMCFSAYRDENWQVKFD